MKSSLKKIKLGELTKEELKKVCKAEIKQIASQININKKSLFLLPSCYAT